MHERDRGWDPATRAAAQPILGGQPRQRRNPKVARWWRHLTDKQVVELVTRLFKATAGNGDVDAPLIRDIGAHFAEEMPT